MAPIKRVKKVMTLPINVIFSHLQVSFGDDLFSGACFYADTVLISSVCLLISNFDLTEKDASSSMAL
jgi:hypothetical protein